jgi:hypothetical protein
MNPSRSVSLGHAAVAVPATLSAVARNVMEIFISFLSFE